MLIPHVIDLQRRVLDPELVADELLELTPACVVVLVTASSASALSRALRLSRSGCLSATPFVGLVITLVIFRITWQSWRTIRTGLPQE